MSPRARACLLALLLPAFASAATPLAPPPIDYYYPKKPSFSMAFLSFMLRHVVKPAKRSTKAFADSSIFRRPDVVAAIPQLKGRVVTLHTAQVQGRQVFTLTPAAGAPAGGKVVLYLHGGAYVSSFAPQHWRFMQEVVQQTGYTVVAPDYPLAPQHTYQQVFALVQPVYQDLVARFGAANVLLMGDSAGGGLALALAQKLKAAHAALPSQLILLSPWLDAALENPDIAAVAPHDPFLTVQNLRLAAHAYAGPTPLSDYQLSPLNGDLAGLPRLSVFIGTHDIFVADARKLQRLLRAQGQPLHYFEYNGAIHVFALTKSPEGRQARQQIIDLLKK